MIDWRRNRKKRDRENYLPQLWFWGMYQGGISVDWIRKAYADRNHIWDNPTLIFKRAKYNSLKGNAGFQRKSPEN